MFYLFVLKFINYNLVLALKLFLWVEKGTMQMRHMQLVSNLFRGTVLEELLSNNLAFDDNCNKWYVT